MPMDLLHEKANITVKDKLCIGKQGKLLIRMSLILLWNMQVRKTRLSRIAKYNNNRKIHVINNLVLEKNRKTLLYILPVA